MEQPPGRSRRHGRCPLSQTQEKAPTLSQPGHHRRTLSRPPAPFGNRIFLARGLGRRRSFSPNTQHEFISSGRSAALPVSQTRQDVVPQPWADGSESLQREAERFLAYISTPQLPCSRALSQAGPKAFADSTRGPWRVCLDHLPSLAPKPQQQRCLAYTFSVVKRNSEFARRMNEMGCQVHSFGWTPDRRAEERWQEGRVQHHRVWLDWHEQPPSASSRRQRSASKRLSRIMESLGHEKIDVLEADLASAEWKILESILLDGTVAAVHQLILTLHLHWPGFEQVVYGGDAARWADIARAVAGLRGHRRRHKVQEDFYFSV
ncbi:methyltransferase-like protein 24 [Alligator mississippiensis]|uniref:Methyltransferase-like protein 24 n=1 Tax=Alligator mississippiensis TaxID=8496 RepID=A0A151N917_ALLMI|nr:methyltransferase-like protein 24 [Alligator mississippiensis]